MIKIDRSRWAKFAYIFSVITVLGLANAHEAKAAEDIGSLEADNINNKVMEGDLNAESAVLSWINYFNNMLPKSSIVKSMTKTEISKVPERTWLQWGKDMYIASGVQYAANYVSSFANGFWGKFQQNKTKESSQAYAAGKAYAHSVKKFKHPNNKAMIDLSMSSDALER